MIKGPQMELWTFLCFIKNPKLYEHFYQSKTHFGGKKHKIRVIGNLILYRKICFPNVFIVSGIKNIYSKYFLKYYSTKPKIQISR